MATIERTLQGWRLSAIVDGFLESMHYIGYTKREAQAEFKQHLKERKMIEKHKQEMRDLYNGY